METQKNSLPVIVAEMSGILSQIVEAGGELTPELEAAFDNVGSQIKVKADSYAFLIDKLEAESDFWKAKAESFSKVAKSCKSLRDRLSDSIKTAMVELDMPEVEGEDFRFKLSRTAPRLVLNEEALPKEYLMQVTTYTPDKDRIKAALTDGAKIPGAALEGGFSVRKYVNAKKGK